MSRNSISSGTTPTEDAERPPSIALVALLLAAFAMLAAFYACGILAAMLPFNSGSWVVGEEVAMSGWLGYLVLAIFDGVAAAGLWRQWPWARWLGVLLLAIGLLPAVPGISSAVAELRVSGIILWGALIVVRTAALYVLLSPH